LLYFYGDWPFFIETMTWQFFLTCKLFGLISSRMSLTSSVTDDSPTELKKLNYELTPNSTDFVKCFIEC
jgi:hypothetical protein